MIVGIVPAWKYGTKTILYSLFRNYIVSINCIILTIIVFVGCLIVCATISNTESTTTSGTSASSSSTSSSFCCYFCCIPLSIWTCLCSSHNSLLYVIVLLLSKNTKLSSLSSSIANNQEFIETKYNVSCCDSSCCINGFIEVYISSLQHHDSYSKYLPLLMALLCLFGYRRSSKSSIMAWSNRSSKRKNDATLLTVNKKSSKSTETMNKQHNKHQQQQLIKSSCVTSRTFFHSNTNNSNKHSSLVSLSATMPKQYSNNVEVLYLVARFLMKDIPVLYDDHNTIDDDCNSVSSLLVDTEIDCNGVDMFQRQQPTILVPPVKQVSSLPLENLTISFHCLVISKEILLKILVQDCFVQLTNTFRYVGFVYSGNGRYDPVVSTNYLHAYTKLAEASSSSSSLNACDVIHTMQIVLTKHISQTLYLTFYQSTNVNAYYPIYDDEPITMLTCDDKQSSSSQRNNSNTNETMISSINNNIKFHNGIKPTSRHNKNNNDDIAMQIQGLQYITNRLRSQFCTIIKICHNILAIVEQMTQLTTTTYMLSSSNGINNERLQLQSPSQVQQLVQDLQIIVDQLKSFTT